VHFLEVHYPAETVISRMLLNLFFGCLSLRVPTAGPYLFAFPVSMYAGVRIRITGQGGADACKYCMNGRHKQNGLKVVHPKVHIPKNTFFAETITGIVISMLISTGMPFFINF